jgi:hypothetical protein
MPDESIKQVLMRRDKMTAKEVEDLVRKAKQDLLVLHMLQVITQTTYVSSGSVLNLITSWSLFKGD